MVTGHPEQPTVISEAQFGNELSSSLGIGSHLPPTLCTFFKMIDSVITFTNMCVLYYIIFDLSSVFSNFQEIFFNCLTPPSFCDILIVKKESEIMKTRLPLQVIALFIHVYAIVEIIRVNLYILNTEPPENSFHAAIFTLIIVTACEFLSLLDAILLLQSKKNKYPKIYLALIIINAFFFMGLAYNGTVETVICLSFYIILLIIRIVNLVLNAKEILKKV